MKPRVLPGAEAFRFDAGSTGALLLHGFSGCPASMRPMGEWLAQRGVSVVGPRLPGHGTVWQDLETITWPDWEAEAEQALADLETRATDIVVVGLSMGGALALHVAAKHQERLRGVVAINPQIRRPDLALAPVARVFARSVKGVGNDIKKPGVDEIVYDRIPLRGANQLGKLIRTADAELPSLRLPLLVISSTEDHTVKPSNSKRVFERAASERKEFLSLTNSYHVATLDYDADEVFERILRFLRSLSRSTPPAEAEAGTPEP
jgi:carboxylesterase